MRGTTKSKISNKQGGITTGLKSNPCLYKLSNGFVVRGSTIKRNLMNKVN